MTDNLSVLYDLSRRLCNPEQVRNDANEAMTMVMNMFMDRYVNRAGDAMRRHMVQAKKNPSKEVNLLMAMKPFMGEANWERVDKTVDTLMLYDTIRQLAEPASAMSLSSREGYDYNDSQNYPGEGTETGMVHDDGIYEIDEQCLKEKSMGTPKSLMAGLMIAMLMGR